MFRTERVKKIKPHILRSITFFSENRAANGIMRKKYCTAGRATDKIVRDMRFVRRISNAINTQSEYVIFIDFPRKNGHAKAPRYYVIRTFPVLFVSYRR